MIYPRERERERQGGYSPTKLLNLAILGIAHWEHPVPRQDGEVPADPTNPPCQLPYRLLLIMQQLLSAPKLKWVVGVLLQNNNIQLNPII